MINEPSVSVPDSKKLFPDSYRNRGSEILKYDIDNSARNVRRTANPKLDPTDLCCSSWHCFSSVLKICVVEYQIPLLSCNLQEVLEFGSGFSLFFNPDPDPARPKYPPKSRKNKIAVLSYPSLIFCNKLLIFG